MYMINELVNVKNMIKKYESSAFTKLIKKYRLRKIDRLIIKITDVIKNNILFDYNGIHQLAELYHFVVKTDETDIIYFEGLEAVKLKVNKVFIGDNTVSISLSKESCGTKTDKKSSSYQFTFYNDKDTISVIHVESTQLGSVTNSYYLIKIYENTDPYRILNTFKNLILHRIKCYLNDV